MLRKDFVESFIATFISSILIVIFLATIGFAIWALINLPFWGVVGCFAIALAVCSFICAIWVNGEEIMDWLSEKLEEKQRSEDA